MNRSALKDLAARTLELLELGRYDAQGLPVEIGPALAAARAGTRVYTPARLRRLLDQPGPAGDPARLEVSAETTQVAAQGLAAAGHDVALLNFASARNPGGGFLSGSKAQEEDLARCSGLYPCLLEARAYYQANRAQRSPLYTDHAVYSPGVPFFRVRAEGELLADPFRAAVITSPAPNAGEVRRRGPKERAALGETLRRRAGTVLALARAHGHRALLLGAWGCGVFKNDPAQVADAFAGWLADPRFAGAFELVHFAVYDPSRQQRNLRAFQARFASGDRARPAGA
ncbi:MAG TPA: TIGR02452 family protein [Planctomycetes bacterium]|nr:TIGR02452 family protein [Planctomycetota bacterium]